MQQVKLSQFLIQRVKRPRSVTGLYQDHDDDKGSDDDDDDTDSETFSGWPRITVS